jgi:hypothetical protein
MKAAEKNEQGGYFESPSSNPDGSVEYKSIAPTQGEESVATILAALQEKVDQQREPNGFQSKEELNALGQLRHGPSRAHDCHTSDLEGKDNARDERGGLRSGFQFGHGATVG